MPYCCVVAIDLIAYRMIEIQVPSKKFYYVIILFALLAAWLYG